MSAGTTAAPARWGRRGLNAFCVVVTLLAVAFLAPSLMGLQRYAIAGGSMTGTYDLGSIVFDEVVPVADLSVGDVITYLPPATSDVDHLVTHRIVSIHGDRYRTKGDANPDIDPWTFRLTAATQPRVVAAVPYAGWVLLALQSRSTRMLAIGVPAALIALLSLLQLVRALRTGRTAPVLAPVVAAVGPEPEPAGATTTVVLVSPEDHPIPLLPRTARPRPTLPRQRPAHAALAARPALPRQRAQQTTLVTPVVPSATETAGEVRA